MICARVMMCGGSYFSWPPFKRNMKKSECVYRRKARCIYTNWPPLVIICLTDHHLSPGHVSKSFNAVCARGGALERGGVLCARASECSRGGRDINPSYFLLRRTRTLDTHTHRGTKPLFIHTRKDEWKSRCSARTLWIWYALLWMCICLWVL